MHIAFAKKDISHNDSLPSEKDSLILGVKNANTNLYNLKIQLKKRGFNGQKNSRLFIVLSL